MNHSGFPSRTIETAIRRLVGVHAATLCPMKPDFSIDEAALQRHVASVAAADGVDGLLINGHAGENYLLAGEEKRRVVALCREAVGPDVFLTSGVNAESSLEAAQHAREAEAAGADAILIFPPNSWALSQDVANVVLHHRYVIDACGLPVMLYQAPVGAGAMAYRGETLEALLKLPRIAGIKEGSWEIAAYEENRRLAKALRPDLAVLGSGDEHLLASYLIGTEGSQVSLAAVAPEPVVALWRAASHGDWPTAHAFHDRIYPLAGAIYREQPGSRATARLKACLKILGRLDHDVARPPFAPLSAAEYRRLEKALADAMDPPVASRNVESIAGMGERR